MLAVSLSSMSSRASTSRAMSSQGATTCNNSLVRRPGLVRIRSSGSSPFVAAQARSTRSTAGREFTRTPSRSNNRARHFTWFRGLLASSSVCPELPGTMGPFSYFRALRDERRRLGWKGLLKRRGWTFVALFVLAYLVRDLVLYVLVPLAIAAGLWR